MFLEQQSCPEAQGYYFNQPVDAEVFTRLLGGRGEDAAVWTPASALLLAVFY